MRSSNFPPVLLYVALTMALTSTVVGFVPYNRESYEKWVMDQQAQSGAEVYNQSNPQENVEQENPLIDLTLSLAPPQPTRNFDPNLNEPYQGAESRPSDQFQNQSPVTYYGEGGSSSHPFSQAGFTSDPNFLQLQAAGSYSEKPFTDTPSGSVSYQPNPYAAGSSQIFPNVEEFSFNPYNPYQELPSGDQNIQIVYPPEPSQTLSFNAHNSYHELPSGNQNIQIVYPAEPSQTLPFNAHNSYHELPSGNQNIQIVYPADPSQTFSFNAHNPYHEISQGYENIQGGYSLGGQSSSVPTYDFAEGTSNEPEISVTDSNPQEATQVAAVRRTQGDCFFTLKALPMLHGVIVTSLSEDSEILYPEEGSTVHIQNEDTFHVVCAGGKRNAIKAKHVDQHKPLSIDVQCKDGTLLYGRDEHEDRYQYEVDVPNDMNCMRMPLTNMVKMNRGHYQVTLHHSVMYSIYVDEPEVGQEGPTQLLYMENSLRKSVTGRENYPFSNVNLRKGVLNIGHQAIFEDTKIRNYLMNQLPSSDVYNWFTFNNSQKISRGWFVTVQDFVYFAEQVGTFYPVNIMPMWSNLKTNWMYIEDAIVDFVTKRDNPLTIYTGPSLEVQKFQVGNEWFPLHIPDKDNQSAETIPSYIWKLVYDPSTGHCVMIVGHNAAHPIENKVCVNDVSTDVEWLEPYLQYNARRAVIGGSYACSCNEKPPYLPDFPITSVLKE